MKKIPDHTLAAIKERVDLVELVRENLPLKKVGREHTACCPFHNEKTPSFTVNATKGFYHCFGCGAHGDQIDWMVNYLGMPWNEAAARLAEQAGVPLEENEDTTRVQAKAAAAQILEKAARWMRRQLDENKQVRRYVLEERKVSPDALDQFMIGFAPKVMQGYMNEFSLKEMEVLGEAGLLGVAAGGRMYPKLGGRLVFPIRDAAGWVIGFSGRLMGEGQPKYMNSPDSPFFSKRNEIFRAPDVRKSARAANCVVVTEGCFDVVALHQAGFGNAVASMGTATTPENLESMFALAPEVMFCFDGDKAGLQAAWKALITSLPVLGDNRLVSFAFVPDGLDPDEFIRARGADAFGELVAAARPLSKFFAESYRKKRETEPLEKHSALMGQAAKQIATVKDEILKNGMAGTIAQVFDVSVAAVQRAGGFSRTGGPMRQQTVPTVRAGAVETIFLANLLRRPWEVDCVSDDVELSMPGGTEIVAALRQARIVDDDQAPQVLRRLFENTPYKPLVERLLESGELDDDIPVNARRIEAAWVTRRLEAMMALPPESLDRGALQAMLVRRLAVLGALEKRA